MSDMNAENRIKLAIGAFFVDAQLMQDQIKALSEQLSAAQARIKELEGESPKED